VNAVHGGDSKRNHTQRANACIAQIGRCIGCDRADRLNDSVCKACLTRRGRKWAEMSHRCRTEAEFALNVYERISSDRGREIFLRLYGEAVLRGRGNTIGMFRSKAAQSKWSWDAELTVFPPK
jgi:hypothetical protein